MEFTVTLTFSDLGSDKLARIMEIYSGKPALAPALNANDDDDNIDINGVVWSDEYHSAKKSRNADGTWRRKRGVSESAASAYELAFQTPASKITWPAVEPATAPASAAPAWPEPPAAVTFEEVNILASKLLMNGQLSMEALTEMCRKAGAANPAADLPNNATACRIVYAALKTMAG